MADLDDTQDASLFFKGVNVLGHPTSLGLFGEQPTAGAGPGADVPLVTSGPTTSAGTTLPGVGGGSLSAAAGGAGGAGGPTSGGISAATPSRGGAGGTAATLQKIIQGLSAADKTRGLAKKLLDESSAAGGAAGIGGLTPETFSQLQGALGEMSAGDLAALVNPTPGSAGFAELDDLAKAFNLPADAFGGFGSFGPTGAGELGGGIGEGAAAASGASGVAPFIGPAISLFSGLASGANPGQTVASAALQAALQYALSAVPIAGLFAAPIVGPFIQGVTDLFTHEGPYIPHRQDAIEQIKQAPDFINSLVMANSPAELEATLRGSAFSTNPEYRFQFNPDTLEFSGGYEAGVSAAQQLNPALQRIVPALRAALAQPDDPASQEFLQSIRGQGRTAMAERRKSSAGLDAERAIAAGWDPAQEDFLTWGNRAGFFQQPDTTSPGP